MMSLRRSRARRETAELNITAFMNLMVVLVPFLLITAVFSRITILELNLPSADNAPPADDKPSLNLTVVVRHDSLSVLAGNRFVKAFPKKEDKYPLDELNTLLVEIKKRDPETLDARVLLEPNVKYETLVSVMDTVRVKIENGAGSELFPVISIGDAAPIGVKQ